MTELTSAALGRVRSRLIPFLFVLYLVAYLDRINISFAASEMSADLGISLAAYGLGAGVWTRSGNTAYRLGRAIEAGRVWTNCYHQYPAHAAFGGYKKSGIGRENHRMMLDHYQQTKNMLVSYNPNKLGFF